MASILIVDDEPENLELLEGILAPMGHLIRKAEGGREALQAVEEELPELILLDLMMPRVSGFSTSPSMAMVHGRIGSFAACEAMRFEAPKPVK